MKFDVFFFKANRLQEFSALLNKYVYPKSIFWKRLPTEEGDYFMMKSGEVCLGSEAPISDIIAANEADAAAALSEMARNLKTAA